MFFIQVEYFSVHGYVKRRGEIGVIDPVLNRIFIPYLFRNRLINPNYSNFQ